MINYKEFLRFRGRMKPKKQVTISRMFKSNEKLRNKLRCDLEI